MGASVVGVDPFWMIHFFGEVILTISTSDNIKNIDLEQSNINTSHGFGGDTKSTFSSMVVGE